MTIARQPAATAPKLCEEHLRHKNYYVSDKYLADKNIRHTRVVQKQNDLMVILEDAYH